MRSVEHVFSELCPQLRDDEHIRDLLYACGIVVANTRGPLDPAPGFLHRIWPHFLQALEHGGDGKQYWLSYDELLALATIADVKLVIVKQDSLYRNKKTENNIIEDGETNHCLRESKNLCF